MNIEELNALAKKRRSLRERFVHQEMMKNYKYYRWWYELDSTFHEWRDNPKTSIKQKNILARMLKLLILLRCEIELKLPVVEGFNFEFYNRCLIEKEKELKEVRTKYYFERKRAAELEEKLRLSEMDNQSLKNVIKFHEEDKDG